MISSRETFTGRSSQPALDRGLKRLGLRDGNYQVVEERKVTANAFGSAAGEFTLPADAVPGEYELVLVARDPAGNRFERREKVRVTLTVGE